MRGTLAAKMTLILRSRVLARLTRDFPILLNLPPASLANDRPRDRPN